MALYGGIEAGGTKFVCGIGSHPDNLILSEKIDTTTPAETFEKVIAFFKSQEPVAAIGIGSFGPIDLNPHSETYGYVTSTPKPHWGNTRFVGAIEDALGVPVRFDTDVNAAAFGEYKWGAAQGLDTFLYLTIGTGIGGGGMIAGQLMHGLVHPEMGHILMPRDPQRDPYEGFCPYHKSCLEGLAAGPAIKGRWGKPGNELPPDHPAWDLEAHYLAIAVANYVCMFSPQRIIMGGGVMHQSNMFSMIRDKAKNYLNGYVQHPAILEHMDQFIVPPGLGDRAGVLGSIALAMGIV